MRIYKPHSEEHKKRISESMKLSWKSKDWSERNLKMSIRAKGRKYTEERNKKVAESMSGKKNALGSKRPKGWLHPNWQGGITSERDKIESTLEYKTWRKSVFDRDDYTCVECGIRGCELNADHIKPFAYFPELRFELSNGRTLCKPCHLKTDTYGGRSKILVSNYK